jgi:hypothetical protein
LSVDNSLAYFQYLYSPPFYGRDKEGDCSSTPCAFPKKDGKKKFKPIISCKSSDTLDGYECALVSSAFHLSNGRIAYMLKGRTV